MADEQDKITLTTLTRKQRRVLGTLVDFKLYDDKANIR